MEPKRPFSRDLGQAWRYDVLGYTFAFTIMMGAGAGYLLDRWLGLKPILTITGTLAGAALAFFWVFMKVSRDEAGYRKDHPPGAKGP